MKPELGGPHLVKALQELAFGGQQDYISRSINSDYDKPAERTQQIQMIVSGTAGGVAVWQDPVPVTFDVYFHCAPGNRDSTLILPHFTYGVVLDTPFPVMVAAHVASWKRDGNFTVSGCNIRWGAWDPSNPAVLTPFKAHLHLSFQGFGAAPDVDSSQLSDDLGTLSGAPGPVTTGDDS